MSDSLQIHGLQHTRLPCPSLSSGVCANSCPLSQGCCVTISSSVSLFCFCLQSFPASWAFLISQLFASGCQGTGASASTSVLPMNIQGWFHLLEPNVTSAAKSLPWVQVWGNGRVHLRETLPSYERRFYPGCTIHQTSQYLPLKETTQTSMCAKACTWE